MNTRAEQDILRHEQGDNYGKKFTSIKDVPQEQTTIELCNCGTKNVKEQEIYVLGKAYCQGCGRRLLPCSFCYGYITEDCEKCPFKRLPK